MNTTAISRGIGACLSASNTLLNTAVFPWQQEPFRGKCLKGQQYCGARKWVEGVGWHRTEDDCDCGYPLSGIVGDSVF